MKETTVAAESEVTESFIAGSSNSWSLTSEKQWIQDVVDRFDVSLDPQRTNTARDVAHATRERFGTAVNFIGLKLVALRYRVYGFSKKDELADDEYTELQSFCYLLINKHRHA